MALTSPEAVFVSTNPHSNSGDPMHGTFIGHEGAQAFFGGFADVLEPGDFEVTAAFGDETHAASYGTLKHIVRATGKPFVSDWALIPQFEDERRILYHFYEDTEALAEAMRRTSLSLIVTVGSRSLSGVVGSASQEIAKLDQKSF